MHWLSSTQAPVLPQGISQNGASGFWREHSPLVANSIHRKLGGVAPFFTLPKTWVRPAVVAVASINDTKKVPAPLPSPTGGGSSSLGSVVQDPKNPSVARETIPIDFVIQFINSQPFAFN
jgi:hypothetical protein